MNTKQTLIRSKGHQRLGLILSATLSLMLFSGSALASTAANHVIRNTATVDYDNAAGVVQTAITAFTDVTVNLVPSTPVLSAPTDISTDSDTDAVYAYTLTATANGPDTYNLTTNITGQTTTGSTAGTSVASLDLGATTVAVAHTIVAGANTIEVPNDGDTADGIINGLANGETVIINSIPFVISGINETFSATTSTFIVTDATNATIGYVLTVGNVIGEQGTFTMSVTPGTGNGTVDVDTEAEDSGAVAAAASDSTQTTVTAIDLTVIKYVANITNPAAGTGSTININTGTGARDYYTGGIVGNPGDTLEYVIEVENSGTSSAASDVRITDPIPAFTTYTASSMRLDPGTGTWAAATDAFNDTDAGETDATTVYIFVGAGGAGDGATLGVGTGGSLPISTTTLGSFRVTIDN